MKEQRSGRKLLLVVKQQERKGSRERGNCETTKGAGKEETMERIPFPGSCLLSLAQQEKKETLQKIKQKTC